MNAKPAAQVGQLEKRIPEDREAILAALREGQTIASAAARGGLSRSSFYSRLREDREFGDAVEEARHEGSQARAEELREVLYAGAGKAGENAAFTGQLIFALTNLDPRHWRNTQHVRQEITADVGLRDMPADEFAREALAAGLTTKEMEELKRLLTAQGDGGGK